MQKSKSKIKIAVIIVAAAIIIPVFIIPLFSFLLFGGSMISSMLFSTVEKPEIRYHEFPLEIVYEYQDQTYTIDDMIVCEYEGADWALDGGKYRSWTGYMKSSSDDRILIDETEEGRLYISPFFSPDYLMGEPGMDDFDPHYGPDFFFVANDEKDFTYINMSDEELQEHFNCSIISWTTPEPIENTFN